MSIGREIEDIARDLIRHQHDHPPVRDLNREIDRRLTLADRVADDFARLVGSWIFVGAQVVIIALWVGLNVLNVIHPWDRYPFLFLNFIFGLEIVVWLSLVLMAVNRMTDRERLRAQHEYELNVKSEEELKALMNHLMHQDEILLQIVNRLDRGDRELKRLARRIEQLVELEDGNSSGAGGSNALQPQSPPRLSVAERPPLNIRTPSA